MRAPQSDGPEYVLAIGVVPDGGSTSISGVSTPALESGDPYYAGGSYDGKFTGEVVLSPAAADILNASSDDSLTVESQATGERVTFAVAAVSESRIRTVGGQVPVALVHLSELQSLTGANEDDLADQILVSTDSPGVKPALERVYPEAAVVERTGLAAQRLGDENLLLAMSVTALVVALAVGVLFVMTTTALEIEADRQQLAVFAVLGFSTRARSIVVVVTTLLIALSGAAVGVLVAAVGSWGINVALTALFASIPIVVFHPLFIVYALCVALVIGMLAVPYPLLLARRTDVLGELT
jgi:putative ABC transport system permease protein